MTTPARQPHPQHMQEEIRGIRFHISKLMDAVEYGLLDDDIVSELFKINEELLGCATHTSLPAPAEIVPVGCSKFSFAECVQCDKRFSLIEHDAGIRIEAAKAAHEKVLGLAGDMYGLMMCVEKVNTDEFMDYYVERMKGLKEQYESLRAQQAGKP